MIERLDLSDAATAREVLDLQRAAYRAEADLIGFDGIPPLHETLDELVAAPLQWMGMRDGHRIVAAMAVRGTERSCDIDRLVVHPDAARRGHGRRLVQSVLPHEWVTVSTASLNTPARTLYASLGFRVMAEREVADGVLVTEYERWNTHLATSFDADVANYEAARPGYPDTLWTALAPFGLRAGADVLESGAGSGQATLPLLDRGAVMTAVEPGLNMAARLRDRVAGRACTVLESTLESALLPDACFDLAVAATSFHWVDSSAGLPVLGTALRPDGHLALWWNVHRGPHDVTDPLAEHLAPITRRFQTDERQQSTTYAFQTDVRVAEIESTGHFEVVHHERIEWPWTHDAASLRALFASFSDWITLPEPDRTRALDDIAAIVDDHFDGSITRTYSTALFVSRLRPRA